MTDNKSAETDKPENKAISPFNGAELPVPGPGRPKGSKDKPASPRAIKGRWIREYQALAKDCKADGYENPLVWMRQECIKMAREGDTEPLKRLLALIGDRRFPYAVDPDQAEVTVRVAEIEAEGARAASEEKAGGQQVNVILGQLGDYARTVMAAPAEVIDVPLVEPSGGAKPKARHRTLPAPDRKEGGTWED